MVATEQESVPVLLYDPSEFGIFLPSQNLILRSHRSPAWHYPKNTSVALICCVVDMTSNV
jgi:hypothetical protein